jgi:hypothetical protein
MSRTLSQALIAFALALVAGCQMDDPVPLPPTSTGPAPHPQPRPGPVDAGDTDTPFPDGGAIDAADISCGDFGSVCCPDGRACVADFTRCDAQLGICSACGDGGGDCCTDGPACRPGLSCTGNVCGP